MKMVGLERLYLRNSWTRWGILQWMLFSWSPTVNLVRIASWPSNIDWILMNIVYQPSTVFLSLCLYVCGKERFFQWNADTFSKDRITKCPIIPILSEHFIKWTQFFKISKITKFILDSETAVCKRHFNMS